MELEILFNNIAASIHKKDNKTDGIIPSDFPKRIDELSSSGEQGVDWHVFNHDMATSISHSVEKDGNFLCFIKSSNKNSVVETSDFKAFKETPLTYPVNSSITNVAFVNGIYIMQFNNFLYNIYYTTNLIDWEVISNPLGRVQVQIAFCNGIYVLSISSNGIESKVYSGPDLNSLESSPFVSGITKEVMDLLVFQETFVLLTLDNIYCSTDGVNWESKNFPESNLGNRTSSCTKMIAHNDKLYLTLFSRHYLFVTKDLKTWDKISLPEGSSDNLDYETTLLSTDKSAYLISKKVKNISSGAMDDSYFYKITDDSLTRIETSFPKMYDAFITSTSKYLIGYLSNYPYIGFYS